MGIIRRDRRPKAATVWANQLEKMCKSITLVSGYADGEPFRLALENQHRREPNNLIKKKVAVMLGFDPEVKITGLRIRGRWLLLEWIIGEVEMPKFKRGRDYPEMCPECRARIDMFATALEVGSADERPEKPLALAVEQGLLCGGRRCVYELIPKGRCSVRLVEYDEKGEVEREYSLPGLLEAEKATSKAEEMALVFKRLLGEGASIHRDETNDYWEVLDAEGEPRLIIQVMPTGESSTVTVTRGDE